MTEAPAPTRWRARRVIPVVAGIVLMVACAAFIVKVLVDDWSEVSDELANASWGWLAAGLGFAVAGMTVIAATWADALAAMGGKMTRTQSVAWYYVGDIGKYLPGSIWAAVGRGEIARRRGVPVGQAYPSVALSLVALYMAAVLTVGILIPFDLAHSSDAGPWLFLLLLVPVGLFVLHPKVLGALIKFAERLIRRSIPVGIPEWRDTVLLLFRYVPAWIAIAAATWCIARSFPGVDAPVLRIALATVLSWTAGFVTPTPGGAGVREAVFVAVSGLAAGPAVAVAITARIIFVIVDVVGALAGLPATRRRGAREGRVDSLASAVPHTHVDEEG